MMKKTITLICILMMYCWAGYAQSEIELFNYDTLYIPAGYKTLDGGFILGGKGRNYLDDANPGFNLMRTNDELDLVWDEYYHSDEKVFLHDIAVASNGDFITVGVRQTNTSTDVLTLSRMDDAGDLIWTRVYPEIPILSWYRIDAAIIEDSNGDIIVAVGGASNGYDIPHMMKLDNLGNVIWVQSYFNTGPESQIDYIISDVIEMDNGWYALTGYNKGSPYRGVAIITNNAGSAINEFVMNTGANKDYPETIIQTSDGNLLTVGRATDGTNLVFIDPLNGVQSTQHYPDFHAYDVKEMETPQGLNDGFIISGAHLDSDFYGEDLYYRGRLVRIDATMNIVYEREFPYFIGRGLQVYVEEDDTYSVVCGMWRWGNQEEWSKGGGIMRTNAQGLLDGSYFIEGQLYLDEDNDCNKDYFESGTNGWIVVAQGAETYYGITDWQGNYQIECPIGTYDVNIYPPSENWDTSCQPDGHNVVIDGTFWVSSLNDFGVRTSFDCPRLKVDISSPRLVRCQDNLLIVSYCNQGDLPATDAYVEVTLDPYMTYVSSTIPPTTQTGNFLVFDLGDIDALECNGFGIRAYVGCNDVVLGQNHCNKAHIYPDTTCTEPLPEWDGSEVAISAVCEGDSMAVIIENVGLFDMTNSRAFYVFEDHIMKDQGDVQLDAGENVTMKYPTSGVSFMARVLQTEAHPSNSIYESVVVEGCVETPGSPFSTGIISQFGDYSEEEYLSIECRPNVGPFDPNDKIAFPVGYQAEHYIEQTDNLEYMIRFQNTGTDTAHTVIVKDLISEFLDITTIRNISSSHDYEMTIEDDGELIFRFDDIMLPDSFVNEPASNGFIKFEIDQVSNNPIGTVIYNSAGIYFDFNEPIITNETFHTVGEDYFIIDLVDMTNDLMGVDFVKVFPNPSSGDVNFEIGGEINNLDLVLYDIMGRELKRKRQLPNSFQLDKGGVNTGIYFYKLQKDNIPIATGKIILK